MNALKTPTCTHARTHMHRDTCTHADIHTHAHTHKLTHTAQAAETISIHGGTFLPFLSALSVEIPKNYIYFLVNIDILFHNHM